MKSPVLKLPFSSKALFISSNRNAAAPSINVAPPSFGTDNPFNLEKILFSPPPGIIFNNLPTNGKPNIPE